MHTDTYWATIDFRPAPVGWRLAYLPDTPRGPLVCEPLPGWLVQELVTFNVPDGTEVPSAHRPRRAIAAMVVPGEELYPATDHTDFWMELGPEQEICADDIRKAVEERRGVATPEATS